MRVRNPLALLALGLVGAVALLAVANALWFQVLTINANVSTSELKVGWLGFSCSDNEPGGFTRLGWPDQTKDVGKFVPPAIDPATGFFPDEATLIVTNAYPGYAIDCEVELVNLGKVPVHIERWLITIDDPTTPQDPDIVKECVAGTCKTFLNGPDLYDLSPLTPPDPVYAELVHAVGCQLHEGEGKSGSFLFGVRQPAQEHTTYVIKLKVQVNQWNESGWIGCDAPKNNPVTPVLPLDPSGTPYDPALLGMANQP